MLQFTPNLLVQAWFILARALSCHHNLHWAHKLNKINQANTIVPTLGQLPGQKLLKKVQASG